MDETRNEVTAGRRVLPGEGFREYAARRMRDTGTAGGRDGASAEREGREAQRRSDAYARARGRL